MTELKQATANLVPELRDELVVYNFESDRLTGDELVLPNTIHEIKLKPNEFVVSETINYSLDRLYENWLYLISTSVIPSNNIPNNDYFTKFVGDSGAGTKWVSLPVDFPVASGAFINNSLSGVRKLSVVKNVADPKNINIIATTTTNLILLSAYEDISIDIIVNNDDINNIIPSNSDITHPSNGIRFKNILNHVITDQNDLFVLDGELKTVFKFDISGILTLDKSILLNDTPGRLMTGMIGGTGGVQDKTKFNEPVVIETTNNLIHVLDYSKNQTQVKTFDSELNWIKSNDITSNIEANPIDMKYNPNTRRFYIMCHDRTYKVMTDPDFINEPEFDLLSDGDYTDWFDNVYTEWLLNYFKFDTTKHSEINDPLIPHILVFEDDFTFVERVNLVDPRVHDYNIANEVYRCIKFSKENPNIAYILTDKNVYKKYVTRLNRFIGNFLLNEKDIGPGDNGDQNFMDLTINDVVVVNNDTYIDKDELLLFDGQFQVMYRFLEDSSYENSLQDQFDEKVLYSDDLMIKDDEYISTLTYNKTISSHLYNNMLLLENISRKFTTKYDTKGISKYIGFTYLNHDDIENLDYKITTDNYIGVNEPVVTDVINRCLNQILELQQKVTNLMQERPINVYPLLTEPVVLEAPEEN